MFVVYTFVCTYIIEYISLLRICISENGSVYMFSSPDVGAVFSPARIILYVYYMHIAIVFKDISIQVDMKIIPMCVT